jgi:hypothetical protein
MAVVKVKQINTINIKELVLMAIHSGKTSNVDIARWIISSSPYWRIKGYTEIMKELSK